MKIPVRYLSFKNDVPPTGYWDHKMLGDLLSGKFGRSPHGFEYETVHHDDFDGGIIVFPARAQTDCLEQLQTYLLKFDWCILMLTGDEENVFPFEKLQHENMQIYVMSPRTTPRYDNVEFLGTGYAPAIDHLPLYAPEKTHNYFFAGQITHERRSDMDAAIVQMETNNYMAGMYVPTKSFTAGLPPDQYINELAKSKVAYCPSGPETPDTFRLFEALEAGCVPIVDTRVQSSKNNADFGDDYWERFFGAPVPFPVITDWKDLHGYTLDVLKNWDAMSVAVGDWWLRQKRKMAITLSDHVHRLSGLTPIRVEPVTVLMPTSPIASHPDTQMIAETISHTMMHFGEPAELILMADGISETTEQYRDNYYEYLRRMIYSASRQDFGMLVLTHDEHQHQANMTREALGYVNTETILFVEHDAPLVIDYEFDFDLLTQPILAGHANVIRFHHESHVLQPHRHLMLRQPTTVSGVRMWRTQQWSQRPHLASTEFYRTMLATYFADERKTMIEDVMHGVVDNKVNDGGIMAWYEFRLWMYYPVGDNIKRSYHLDGRGDDKKVIDGETVVDL